MRRFFVNLFALDQRHPPGWLMLTLILANGVVFGVLFAAAIKATFPMPH